jgi:luciferase family oxidoreductase group 1
MQLSVLDQSPIPWRGDGGDALRASLALARAADRMGYHRFWMAEHHGSAALACASPEVMLARILGETGRIRVGTGGVMLPHYSPFKVAESFSMLAALGPDRVDLGLGRAPGSDPLTAFALQQDRRQRAAHDFPGQVAELLAYFDRALPANHPFRHLGLRLPGGAAMPEIWVLGSIEDSAQLAGILGLPYCIAEFIAGHRPDLARLYRQHFRPSPRAAAPRLMVALWCICAGTTEEAQWLAAPSRMMFAKLLAGDSIPVPHPDEALAWLADRPAPDRPGMAPVIGGPEEVLARLSAIELAYGADEMMLVNIMHDPESRIRSLGLVAERLQAVPA